MILRAVFRLGVVEVGPGYVRYYNATAKATITLNQSEEARWRDWMEHQSYAPVERLPITREG